MYNTENSVKKKVFGLEERTEKFARNCRDFIKKLPKNIQNIEYGRQLVRSSGSQAANYIEANEKLSKKDFIFRIKICRKEAKESCLWLRLCEPNLEEKNIFDKLIQEGIELREIFTSILAKTI